jgi:biotin-dependent carboxylase-like uncharacterized protein
MSRSITVVRTGPLALLQDAGRVGHAADGVGRSGAADRASYQQANDLVGNPAGATAIECVLGGLALRAGSDLIIAVTGAPAAADIDGEPVEHATALLLAAGQTLRLRTSRTGLRTYVAFAGGLDVPTVLGSSSTDTLSQLGPAPLAKGDELPIGAHQSSPPTGGGRTTPIGEPVTSLRVRLGPRDDWFDNPVDLAVGEWQVSPHSNRVGVRLDRPAETATTLRRSITREMPSEGLPLGAVQVPPSGQPVLFLADHPLTGGYPVIAVVLDDDIDRAAQVRPGQRLRFILTP